MKKTLLGAVSMLLLHGHAYAADGQVLINQATVNATGGFPYKITQPGSYKLSGNLTVPDANTDGILISASFVTIDLNGFSIVGPTVCRASCSPTGTGTGVKLGNTGAFRSITVTNGTVSGMGLHGIDLRNVGNIVTNVHAESNGADGILVGTGVVSDNTSQLNGANGFEISSGVVRGNYADANFQVGILIGGCPTSITANAASGNLKGDISLPAASTCVAANNSPAP